MRKIAYILPLFLIMLSISSKPAFAADWNWDSDVLQLKNHGLTSFTLTYDNKNDLGNGGSIDFCQSSTGVNNDGYGFVFAGQDAYIIDYANGGAEIYNGLSHTQSGSNTISIDCLTGHFSINGITLTTNAVSTAGTYNNISLTDGTRTDNGNVFDPSYIGNYYVSSPVVVGTPPPSPTPSPTPSSGSIVFQDSFTDTDGTTLQQHNSQWANVQGNGVGDMVIQSNKATAPSGQLSAYLLNGFSQEGNQCVSGKFTVGSLNNLGNMGLALNVNSSLSSGYSVTILRNSNDTLTWTLDDLGGDQLFIRKISPQAYDWNQAHTVRFCDLDNVLFFIIDDVTFYTTSDLNLATSGSPAIGLYPTNNTLDDFIYSTGIPSATANVAPGVGSINVSQSPVQINTATTASASFTDANTGDTHTATWNWGDGNTTAGTIKESNGSGTVSNSHSYASSGVYTVTLTIADNSNASATATYQYVVVYDASPQAGFLTGSGKYDSLAGWDVQDPSVTGQVKFGIQAKYTGGNITPIGQTKWNFKNGNLDFVSTSYDWLVVSGAKATLKGHGTINGTGNYTFLASGIDGSQAGGSDKIRFQIKDASGNLVYDSQSGAADTADPTTVSTGGTIKVH